MRRRLEEIHRDKMSKLKVNSNHLGKASMLPRRNGCAAFNRVPLNPKVPKIASGSWK